MASQVDRVLALLRARGNKGLNTTDLHAPACDGGAPIIRLAARVRDLQDRGYRITSERKLNGTATYRLVGEPVEQQAASEAKEPPVIEQAGPGSVSSSEGVRLALSAAEPVSLFDRDDTYKDLVA